jgi:tetratricopeptide (TPR) repeat protein
MKRSSSVLAVATGLLSLVPITLARVETACAYSPPGTGTSWLSGLRSERQRFRCGHRAGRWSRYLVVAGAVALAVTHPLWSATCVGPAPLEARVRSQPSADAYETLGIWFGENHNSECAAQTFQAGLKLEPDSPRLPYLLGLSLYTAGKPAESAAPLRQAVKQHPDEEKAHLLLASALVELGRTKEAFVEWQAALRIDPGSKMALDGIARILLAAGDNESVISGLESVQRDENLTLDLATAYQRTGLFNDAVRVLNEGTQTYPDSAALTSSLVSVDVKLSLFDEATKVAEQLASRNPQDIEAQRVYLSVLVFNADNQTATPLARKLLAQAPHDADFLYLNGVLERTAGDFAAARRHLEEAAKLDPNKYSTRYNLGYTLEQLQDYAGAKEQLQKALELDPTEPESHFELGKVLRKLGDNDAAQQELVLYQKQVKAKSDHTIAAQKSTQAAEAARTGDKQKAAALYREAIAVLPDNAGLHYQLALVLDGLNDIDGERSALEQTVKIDPSFALAQYRLGILDTQKGDAGGAVQQFRLAVNASPGYVQAWIALGAALATESRVPDALQAVDTALKIDPTNSAGLELRNRLVSGDAKH